MSISEKIAAKAFDQVLDMIIGKTTNEIAQLLKKDQRCSMLEKTLQWFSTSPIAQTEYKRLKYEPIKVSDYLLEQDLDPTQSSSEIAEKIKKVVQICFKNIDDCELDTLSKFLSEYYKQRAKVSVELCEVSSQIQRSQTMIEAENLNIKVMLNKQEELQQQMEIKKQYIYDKYIRNKMHQLAIDASNSYLYFIKKQPPEQYSGEQKIGPVIKNLQSTLNHIDSLVQADFFTNNIKSFVNTNDGTLNTISATISPLNYVQKMLLPSLTKELNEIIIKYSSQLPDNLYLAVLELDMELQNNFIFAIAKSGQHRILEASAILNISDFKNIIRKPGEVILNLCELLNE